MKKLIVIFFSLHLLPCFSQQLPPVFTAEETQHTLSDSRAHVYIYPSRIIWQSDKSGKYIKDEAFLLNKGDGQSELGKANTCTLRSDAVTKPGILFDFGKELQGGIRIVTGEMQKKDTLRVRIRFGESASEAMCDITPQSGATNDHAMRDIIVELPWLGTLELGNTGFRFVRIDLVDPNKELLIKEISANFTFRDIPYKGSFKSNDERLNKIWLTGAYTVHLNMQQFLWDGIKRDRLVWVGDMHPEVMTINTVFGYNEVVPKSLDQAKRLAVLPNWMNGISSYSMWWIIIHRDWYYYQGDLNYLKQQRDYLIPLLDLLIQKIDKNNKENLDGGRFLDWPSSENAQGVHAGLQSLMIMALQAGADIMQILNEPAVSTKCNNAIAKLKKHIPDANNSKQGAALMALAGVAPAEKINTEILSKGGTKNFSTFYGYYMLQAKAKAGDYQGGLDNIREFWGAMLDLGATTFWEDFNMQWLPDASRIDALVPQGKKDIHGDYGAYCYRGFRHSLCHGWSSGPTSWLTQHVLGVSVVEPGCKTIKIEPHLGDLTWVEGTFPTPYGIVTIKHTKQNDGRVVSDVHAPKEVKVIQ